MKIKILVDAASNLFKKILKEKNVDIKVLNMRLMIGENSYNCYDDDFDVDEFSNTYYEAIKNGEQVHTTLISPGEYLESFQKEVNQGNYVICYTMARGISGTYESACLARDEINAKYDEPRVYIIDSMTAGFGEGLQALHAFEVAKNYEDIGDLVEYLEQFRLKVRSEFTVDDIRYLLKTGRVSRYLAKFIKLINIKVLLKSGDESKIVFAGPAFGRKNSIKKLADMVISKVDQDFPQIIYITHCNILEDAEKLKELIVEGGVKTNIEIYQYDFISGAHIGPNSLAVFYVSKLEDKD